MSSSAGIIIIGDEILSGRTKDTNINWIANELNELGIKLKEARVIEDDKKTIINTVLEFSKKFTYAAETDTFLFASSICSDSSLNSAFARNTTSSVDF